MRIIAHRGGRGFGTDNTLAAMENAVRSGVSAIETDVRSTEDGELVICHDAMVWGRLIKHMSYRELKRQSPERPLLREVMEALAGWVRFNIEIKEAPASEVAAVLDSYSIASDTVVTSFDWEIIEEYNRVSPQTLTGHLYRMPYAWEKKVARSKRIGSGVIAPYFNSIDEELVQTAHATGLQVYAWTVNSEEDFKRLNGWGVDAVITDRYLKMSELLSRLDAKE